MPKPSVMAHQWEQLSSLNEFYQFDYIKPTLGYNDPRTIDSMEWEIDTARKNGIEWFIFDHYLSPDTGEEWFNESFEAFLKSKNRKSIKFALMYTNANGNTPLSARRRIEHFDKFVRLVKITADANDNYLSINNRPLLILWRPELIYQAFISTETTKLTSNKDKINLFRKYLNDVYSKYFGTDKTAWPIFISAGMPFTIKQAEICKSIGVEAVIPYNTYVNLPKPATGKFADNQGQITYSQFSKVVVDNNDTLGKSAQKSGLFYVPSIPAGYSKIALMNYTSEVVDADDAAYKQLLLKVLHDADENNSVLKYNGKKLVVLGAWNEWSNGHAIAPGRLGQFRNEYGRLNVISQVFKGSNVRILKPKQQDVSSYPVIFSNYLDFAKNKNVQYFSWVQKAKLTRNGIQFRFDKSVRLEIPWSYSFKLHLPVLLVRISMGNIVNRGSLMHVVVKCKLRGYPTWESIYGKTTVRVSDKEMILAVPMRITTESIGNNITSGNIRSVDITFNLSEDIQADRIDDLFVLTLKSITFSDTMPNDHDKSTSNRGV